MVSQFGLDGFYNWDTIAAAFLAESSLFSSLNHRLTPSLQGLANGFLERSTHDDARSRTINLPRISDSTRLSEDIYDAWLGG